MCTHFTEIEIVSTPLFHTPGILRYIRNAYLTGDEETAVDMLASIFDGRVKPEAYPHLLESRATSVTVGDSEIFAIPNQWIIKEETPS